LIYMCAKFQKFLRRGNTVLRVQTELHELVFRLTVSVCITVSYL
jgi:hypothetical protein